MTPQKTILSWSGGKDCCMALHTMLCGSRHDVTTLLTTVDRDDGRIPVHGVSSDIIRRQAESLDLPLQLVPLPARATNLAYEAVLLAALEGPRAAGVESIAFGDLFLADIRRYREDLVARAGLIPVFPLWGVNTAELARDFISAGFQAIVVAVDPAVLDKTFVGSMFDANFLAALPEQVDPCGENGEFHSFVFDGPGFATPVDVKL